MLEQAPRVQQTAYTLGGVIYLPHYTRKDRFVGPGFSGDIAETKTSAQLDALGAKPSLLFLWPRKHPA